MSKIIIIRGAVLALALGLSAPAFAQSKSFLGRYTMYKAEDGFIRLDTQTGEVSLCQKTDAAWNCAPMGDAEQKLKTRIAELRDRNAALEAEIRTLKSALASRDGVQPEDRYSDRPDTDAGPPPGSRQQFRLPTEKEVDKALDYFERMLRKFQDRLQRLEKDAPPPKQGDSGPDEQDQPQPKKEL